MKIKMIHPSCPNMKFHIKGKEVSTDAKGEIEVEGAELISIFEKSGFKPSKPLSEKEQKKLAEELGDKEEPKEQEGQQEEPEEVQPEVETPKVQPKPESTKSWQRGK